MGSEMCIRDRPRVCEPNATAQCRAATATAEPLLDPPGVCAAFQGLIVGEGSLHANSVVTVLPRIMAPAALSRTTVVASSSGTWLAYTLEHAVVGMPAVQ